MRTRTDVQTNFQKSEIKPDPSNDFDEWAEWAKEEVFPKSGQGRKPPTLTLISNPNPIPLSRGINEYLDLPKSDFSTECEALNQLAETIIAAEGKPKTKLERLARDFRTRFKEFSIIGGNYVEVSYSKHLFEDELERFGVGK